MWQKNKWNYLLLRKFTVALTESAEVSLKHDKIWKINMLLNDNPTMTNSAEPQTNESVSLEELTEVIEQFEQYRERLLNDSMETAKRAKMKKSEVMAQIQPELDKIDTALEQLQKQREILTSA